MKLKVVVYTLYITQLMTGAYQALMQGVIFREIITNSAFLKCKGKGKGKSSSHSHLCLFLHKNFLLASLLQEAN